MKANEVKNESVSNVVVIEDATAKLNLEVGNVYEFEGRKLTISAKRSHSEEDPTTGKKTLWSGEIDGVKFDEIDVTKLRKLFGLAERKREKSAGKTFEFEGNVYKLDETADAMIESAKTRYNELKTLFDVFCKQYGITSDEDAEKAITAKVEAVCLARKVAAEEEAKRIAVEKEAKAKASREHKAKVKDAKSEFFALLASGCSFADVTAKIAEKYGLQVSDLA